MKFRILLALLAVILTPPVVYAQFPGFPPSGSVQVGQSGTALPQWLTMGKDCSLANTGLITCLSTNGVPFYTGLPAPNNAADAATKQYVDAVASGLSAHIQARLATAAALPANVYNNGAAGVGATLTAAGNAALDVDSVAVATNDRLVIKNEITTENNGIYVVTNPGAAGTKYVLTRATDANSAGSSNPNKLGLGTYEFVTEGTLNVNTGWLVISVVTAIGTDPVAWSQFNGGVGVANLGGMNGAIICGAGVRCASSTLSAASAPQGRLTLQTGTPVMTTTQVSTSVHYDCFHGGNLVPYYNGTSDAMDAIGGCEVTTALQNAGAGVLNSAGVFDVWWEGNTNHNICVATNGAGGGWASDTAGTNLARGTGYSQLDTTTRPYITNKNAVADCYNGATNYGAILANRLTYLGTIYTTAAGQTSWQYGVTGATPTPGCFCIWNAYNRVDASTLFGDNSGSWSYASATVRATAGDTTTYRVTFVAGLQEDAITATHAGYSVVTSGVNGGLGISGVCFNVTNALSGSWGLSANSGTGINLSGGGMMGGYTTTALGVNFVSACERALATGFSQTWSGADYDKLMLQGRF